MIRAIEGIRKVLGWWCLVESRVEVLRWGDKAFKVPFLAEAGASG